MQYSDKPTTLKIEINHFDLVSKNCFVLIKQPLDITTHMVDVQLQQFAVFNVIGFTSL